MGLTALGSARLLLCHSKRVGQAGPPCAGRTRLPCTQLSATLAATHSARALGRRGAGVTSGRRSREHCQGGLVKTERGGASHLERGRLETDESRTKKLKVKCPISHQTRGCVSKGGVEVLQKLPGEKRGPQEHQGLCHVSLCTRLWLTWETTRLGFFPRPLRAKAEATCVCDSHRKLLPDKGAGEGVGDTLAPSCPVLITSPDAAKTLVLAAS